MTDEAPRPIFHVCVTRDNSYMVQRQKTEGRPPAKFLMPFVNTADPRLFVRNGELIKPYSIIEFELCEMVGLPEVSHDQAIYAEVGRTEFDPAGCVPIQYFNLEKVAEDLNAAEPEVENIVADESLQNNG